MTDTGFFDSGYQEPYALTNDDLNDYKLSLANLQPNELLIDLGAGDARTLIRAHQQYGIKGIGYEILPEALKDAHNNIAQANLEEHIEIKVEDFLTADVSQADALVLYLSRWILGQLSLKLEQELKSGCRIITHDFDIPAWEAEEKSIFRTNAGVDIEVYKYVVP